MGIMLKHSRTSGVYTCYKVQTDSLLLYFKQIISYMKLI